MLQCGSTDGQGSGDPSYMYGPIENAPADDVYAEGTIAMARQGNNADRTATSSSSSTATPPSPRTPPAATA